jgi:hypothetical protein
MRGNQRLTSAITLLLATLLIRAVALGQPQVDVDEQFYLLVGDRMLHGALPYVDIWDRKPVGLFAIYAAARAFGGTGIVQYQLAALLSVFATAWTIRATSLRLGANCIGAWLSGLAYVLWLNILGGAGGQAPIFFNMPMALAGLFIVREIDTPGNGASRPGTSSLVRSGLLCMLLVGIAIQIKYSVLFEGIYFGVALLALAIARRMPHWALAAFAGGMIALALLPTAVALGYYWHAGHLREFIFANFVSIGGRLPLPPNEVLRRATMMAVVMLPLVSFTVVSLTWHEHGGSAREWGRRFILMWLAVAIASVIGFGYYFDHYGLPIVIPAAIAGSAAFSEWRKRRFHIAGLFVLAFLAGEEVTLNEIWSSGGWSNIQAIERATRGVRNCPFVYDGPSAVIMLRHWCIPTVYPFPYHLSYYPESQALGVDALHEVARIMSTHPDAVLIRNRPYTNENLAARALMLRFLRSDYRPVAALPFHQSELLVFRLKPGIAPQSNDVMSHAPRLS